MLGKMLCLTLQSMWRTNHKFPVCATWNVQTQPRSTVRLPIPCCEYGKFMVCTAHRLQCMTLHFPSINSYTQHGMFKRTRKSTLLPIVGPRKVSGFSQKGSLSQAYHLRAT